MRAAKTVYVSSSLHEKILSVSSIGSALGADKKNHLTVEFFDNVYGAAATRASTKRSSAYGRGDGVCAARGLSVARLALGLWSLEFGVHPLAALVSVRIVGASVGVVGTAGPRQVALSGRQPCQSASRRQPSCGRPTKSGHRTHQRRSEHQSQCVGGWPGSSGESELGSGTAPRCVRRANGSATATTWHDYSGRQRLRQRWFSGAVAALGPSLVSPAALQPAYTRGVASWSLPTALPSGELVSTTETLPQNWHSL